MSANMTRAEFAGVMEEALSNDIVLALPEGWREALRKFAADPPRRVAWGQFRVLRPAPPPAMQTKSTPCDCPATAVGLYRPLLRGPQRYRCVFTPFDGDVYRAAYALPRVFDNLLAVRFGADPRRFDYVLEIT